MEAKFADADYAQQTYRSVVRRTLDAGVSEACHFRLYICIYFLDNYLLLLWDLAPGGYKDTR